MDSISITKKVDRKNLVLRYIILSFCMFCSALLFNLVQLPTNLVSGGTSGVAIILDEIFHFNPAITILSLSIVLLLFSFVFLGFAKTTGSVVATILYPVFVDLTEPIVTQIPIDTSDLLLIAIFVGVASGIITGITYKIGFNDGGFSIVSQILYQYFHISISTSSLYINGIIVLVGGAIFGWTMVMYAVIVIYIKSVLMDRVILGISHNKTFYVITSEEERVKQYIMKELKHGVTVFPVKGGFESKRRHVLMTVVPNRDYFKLTEGVKEIDASAFFIASDSYQASGGE